MPSVLRRVGWEREGGGKVGTVMGGEERRWTSVGTDSEGQVEEVEVEKWVKGFSFIVGEGGLALLLLLLGCATLAEEGSMMEEEAAEEIAWKECNRHREDVKRHISRM